MTSFETIMKNVAFDPEFDASLLLNRLKEDDETAFAGIVRHFTPELYRTAYRFTKNSEDAEDLLQDVFSEIWANRHRLYIKTSLKSYLYVALKHRFLRKLMRADLQDRALAHISERMQQIEYSVVDMMEAFDVRVTISQAVSALPEHMQKIFLLRGEDHSIKEIAAALGLAEQTVKTYNMELKRRIREALVTRHPDISHFLLLYILSSLYLS